MRHLFVPLLALALQTPCAAGAEESLASAKVECAPVPEPGRVRCEVELRAPRGRTIQWADVEVVRAPPFASPLRARVGPLETSAREDAVWRWAIALAAKSHGSGPLELRVRAVLCAAGGEHPGGCVPAEVRASAPLVVGP